MEGFALNEDTEKRRDYIPFLDQVLQVCITFKKKLKTGYKEIFFREPNIEGTWHKIREEGWGNQLSSCVYNCISTNCKWLEISESVAETNTEKIKLTNQFGVQQKKVDKLFEQQVYDKLIGFLDELKTRFVDERITERLERECHAFLSNREIISRKNSVFDLKKYEIDAYLESYYDLLTTCVIYYNIFDQSDERGSFIDMLLHLDADADSERGNYILNFRAPVILNKLQKVNYGIEEFFEQITREGVAESSALQEIYKHVLLSKTQHIFRWYLPGKNRELTHAAIAPYSEHVQKELHFQIVARNLKKYNSYEGIGELRLGEKIIYEYGLLDIGSSSQFSVAIMGDLNEAPLEELYRYAAAKLERKYGKKPELVFHIYTKNSLISRNKYIIYMGAPGEALQNRDALAEVIETNRIVFILDCIELYKSPVVSEKKSDDFYIQKYVFSDYDEYNTGAVKNADICDRNAFEDIYEALTCEQCFGQFGRVEKHANEPLLEFCEKKQKEQGNRSAIYIYVSDLQAFEDIYNDDQYYIRTEKYNEKEIGIIRYSSEKVVPLKLKGRDRMLVFNIWQFIKNVAIDERNIFCEKWNSLKNGYDDLDQIYVGIDYANWPDMLFLHYYSEETAYEEIAVDFIKEILLPIMNNRNHDMFIRYIKKAMYSFFYSAAKSVNDMLFIHLFQDKEKLLGKVILAENNDNEKVERNINRYFKYSSKRFYDMIMKNYDISSDCYIGQMRTYRIISKNEMPDNGINRKDIYKNVINACTNLAYGNGYLAKNCKKEL